MTGTQKTVDSRYYAYYSCLISFYNNDDDDEDHDVASSTYLTFSMYR